MKQTSLLLRADMVLRRLPFPVFRCSISTLRDYTLARKKGPVRCSNLVQAQFLPKPSGKGQKFPFSRNSAAVKGKRPGREGAI